MYPSSSLSTLSREGDVGATDNTSLSRRQVNNLSQILHMATLKTESGERFVVLVVENGWWSFHGEGMKIFEVIDVHRLIKP